LYPNFVLHFDGKIQTSLFPLCLIYPGFLNAILVFACYIHIMSIDQQMVWSGGVIFPRDFYTETMKKFYKLLHEFIEELYT